MSLTEYAETIASPLTNVKINSVGKVLKPSKPILLLLIFYKTVGFLSNWTQKSYEAWVRRGRPDVF